MRRPSPIRRSTSPSPQGPEDAKGKTAKGVYKLDGEKLVIAVSVPGHDRPKDFEPAPDEVYLFELKKQKQKD